jgi:hypothetical protein
MTDVSVCQTEGFQAVWRFLRPFRNLSLFDTMLNFVVNLLENERDPRQDQ